MQQKIKLIGYVVIAISLIAAVPHAAYYLGPLFAIVLQLAGVLSGVTAIIGLPVLAYVSAVDSRQVSRRSIWVVAISTTTWFVCLSTRPNVTTESRYTVFGVTEGRAYRPTEEFECFCIKDAEHVAKKLYASRSEWARDSEGRFDECDVKIEGFIFTPSLEWINRLFGTSFGVDSFRTSIRLIETGDDPLGITDKGMNDHFIEMQWDNY